MTNSSQQHIQVYDAGLVLLHPYIPMLFEIIGMTNNRKFTDAQNQMNASLVLNFVATKENLQSQKYAHEQRIAEYMREFEATNEGFLFQNDQSLNKILCGLPVDTVVDESFVLSASQEENIQEMLQVFIERWEGLGKTSVDSLRETFLCRTGILTEDENNWRLTVEKKAYDILLDKLPFSVSTIQLPWMPKPLLVDWR
jgi:hypothetical protein